MNLRLEVWGRVFYLEYGKAEEAEPAPTITDTQYPMVVSAQSLGFRVIGPDEYIEDTDARQARP